VLKIDTSSIVIKEALATKLKFLSLLNFRRMLNTMRGITEDFLDTLVLFNIKLPEIDFEKGVDLKGLVNLGSTHKFMNDLKMNMNQYNYMKENTMTTFIEHMNQFNEDVFLTDFQGDALRDNIKKDRLNQGVILHNDMKNTMKNKIDEIKLLKCVIDRRDKIIADMRTKMLAEIVQLREALFKKRKKDKVFRADMFDSLDMMDPKIQEIMKAKLKDVQDKHDEKMGILQKKFDEQSVKLKYYLEMDGRDNPGFSSILIKRGIAGLKGDRHMVWKVLQECLGRDWYHRVLLKRENNKHYGIDYTAMDEILSELNKIAIRSNPKMIDFLSGPNAEFIHCIVETFRG
jgi:hypothetical protein